MKNIFLLFFLLPGNVLLGQAVAFGTTCGVFQNQQRVDFIKQYPIDSIRALKLADNEKYAALYQDADEEIKTFIDFGFLMEDEAIKLESRSFFESYYLGKVVPFMKSKTIDGKKISAPQKGKITVINTWFTKCKPCIEEMPALNELHEKYKDKVDFIAIARDEKSTILTFLEKHAFAYPIVADKKQKLLANLCLSGYPTNLVIDAEGKIRFGRSGLVDLNAIEKSIQECLQETKM